MPDRLNLPLMAEICEIPECTIGEILGTEAPRRGPAFATGFDPGLVAFSATHSVATDADSSALDKALACGIVAIFEEVGQISQDLEGLRDLLAEPMPRGPMKGERLS